MLAGCMWLPRFVDKARNHFNGTLPRGSWSSCSHGSIILST